ncbi:GAP family protein [Mycolicibacterium celeriflavum]|uniref:GAP family protein n=1 Tax=Mycolicibacterium celeriflavum TaxID=1249101 RepID=UPI003CF52641
MWIPLLLMALAVSLEPFRVGMTVVMLNRPRPALQLFAFVTGGYVMGISVGVVVLFVLRPPLASGDSTLPWVQIVVGAVVLINAALVYTGIVGRSRDIASPGPQNRMSAYLATRARQLLDSRSLWTAGVAGLGIALPSVDYLAALALIVASGSAATIQFGALILFNVLAFALVEIPLLCFLVAPARTRAALSALYDWVREQGRRGISLLLVAVGGVLLAVGFAGL